MEIQNCVSLISTSIEKVLLGITKLSFSLLGNVIVGFCIPSVVTWFITFDYGAKRGTCRTILPSLIRRRSPIGVDINARDQGDQENAVIIVARELGFIGDEMNFKRNLNRSDK